MLFDLRPKKSKKDLFDREWELEELERASDRYPLILLLGIRRIGKTSVAWCFLEGRRGFLVDMRGVVRRADLYERVSRGLEESLGKMRRFLRGIRGIKVAGTEVEIRWRGTDSLSFSGLLTELNKLGRFVVILDEVQYLRQPLLSEVRETIAYAYDSLDNVTFILTGSEIGMVKSFLKLDDPSSPLYGRYAHEVEVRRFTKDQSREFLVRGFEEVGMAPPMEEVERAVEFFDGIVGWLVIFGKSYVDGRGNFEVIAEMATRMALNELMKLSPREKLVLRAIAEGARSWSQVRKFIEEKEGITVAKSSLSRTIKRLERLSLIKDYGFLDPVYERAALRL